MKAAVYHKYGPPEVLILQEFEKPKPKGNEILVKVHASTVTSGVVFIRKGIHPDSKLFTLFLRLVFGVRKPKRGVLGYEVAGVIESVGKDVTAYKPGDQVFGTTTMLKFGAYAEYVCLPEQWKQGVVAIKPENLSYEQAAAIPIGGMTAMFNIQKAGIKEGQKVLVYGASGSVGTFAVQLARIDGARVTGVCSGSNVEMVKSLGVEKVIDYTKENFLESGEQYDVIFDAVGLISKKQSKSLLKKGGVYLSVKNPTKELSGNLAALGELTGTGKLIAVIDRTYPLDQIVAAHEYVDQGHKKGNVVITIGSQT